MIRTRREILSTMARLSLAGVLFGPFSFVPVANAQYAQIIIAVIQAAISVAGLFAGDGGVSQMLQLQVEMLKRISEQLRTIQDGIVYMLNQLNHLEALIGEIPQQVDWRMRQTDIAGAIGRWQAYILPAHEQDRRRGKFDPSKADYWDDLNNVKNILTESAYDLMRGYPSDYRIIPSVCAAAYVDTQIRIIAARGTIAKNCAGYQEWLTNVYEGQAANTVKSELSKLEGEIATQKDSIPKPEDYECVLFRRIVRPQLGVRIGRYQSVQAKSTLEPFDKADKLSQVADEMIKKGIMPETDRPMKVTADFRVVRGPQNFPNPAIAGPKYRELLQMPLCSQKDDPRKQNAVSVSVALANDSPKVVYLRALRWDAIRALRFLKRMQTAPQ